MPGARSPSRPSAPPCSPATRANGPSPCLIGALPLLMIPLLLLFLRETQRYLDISLTRSAASLLATIRAQFAEARRLLEPRFRPRFIIVALLWNCVYLVIAPSVAFWSIYAREEVGMTPAQVGDVVMWSYIAGAFGHLLAGQLVDRIGRKLTCASFYSTEARKDRAARPLDRTFSGARRPCFSAFGFRPSFGFREFGFRVQCSVVGRRSSVPTEH